MGQRCTRYEVKNMMKTEIWVDNYHLIRFQFKKETYKVVHLNYALKNFIVDYTKKIIRQQTDINGYKYLIFVANSTEP